MDSEKYFKIKEILPCKFDLGDKVQSISSWTENLLNDKPIINGKVIVIHRGMEEFISGFVFSSQPSEMPSDSGMIHNFLQIQVRDMDTGKDTGLMNETWFEMKK